VSLDIETTGLNEELDKIWSVGITGLNNGNGWEQFSDPRSSSDIDLKNLFVERSGDFGKQQIERGSIDPLIQAIENNKTVPEKDLVLNTFNNLKNKAILIQNVNFENSRLGNVLGQTDKGFSDMFRYNTVGAKNPNRKLYTPTAVTNTRNEIDTLRVSGGDINEISSLYDKMFSQYNDEFLREDSKSFVIELMDISRGVFAKAAGKGHLSEKTYDSNVKVDFLSNILLGEKESHTSLSDGGQQERIFYRLLDINAELDSGNLSEQTIKQFEAVNSGTTSAMKDKFRSAIDNILEEIKNNGKTRLLPDYPTSLQTIEVNGPKGVEKIQLSRYNSERTTSSIDEAVEHISKKYSKEMEHKDLNQVIDRINENRVDKLQKIVVTSIENNTKRSKVIEGGNKIIDLIKSSTPIEKGVMAGIVGVLTLSMMSGKKEEEPKKEKKNKKTLLNMYDTPSHKIKDNSELNKHYMM
jgi:hypothetical protein